MFACMSRTLLLVALACVLAAADTKPEYEMTTYVGGVLRSGEIGVKHRKVRHEPFGEGGLEEIFDHHVFECLRMEESLAVTICIALYVFGNVRNRSAKQSFEIQVRIHIIPPVQSRAARALFVRPRCH
jgi:hypothetical protein